MLRLACKFVGFLLCAYGTISTAAAQLIDTGPVTDRQAAFVRGGDIIIADGPGIFETFDTPYVAIGYRSPSISFGMEHNRLSLEGELSHFRTSEQSDIGIDIIDTNVWALPILASVRWQWDWDFPIRPYAAAGGGAVYTRLSVEDSFSNFDTTEFSSGLLGRSGIEASLTKDFSLEAGYRYLRVDADSAFGVHGAELGVVWRF
ncbi:MAG: outer membrane beta-barrel protein [Pseudomonadota bacterium]